MPFVRAGGWQSRREAAQDLAFLALAFVLLAGVAAVIFDRACSAWAAAHGHGIHGTWTATGYGWGSRRMDWRGDFAPDNGDRTRFGVELGSDITGPAWVARSLPSCSAMTPEAFAATDTGGWLPLVVFGAVFASLAGAVAWFTVHHLRAPRRRRRRAEQTSGLAGT